MIDTKTLTWVAVGLGLAGACTVVDKGDYTFSDNPDATGGEESGGGTGGARGGASGNSGTGMTAGEGGEATGGRGGTTSGTGGDAGSGTSGDGGGGTGGAGDGCAPNPCDHGGTCTSTGNGFTCDCADGYDGDTCETDINECNPDPCQNGGRCTDHVAAFECTCQSQFTGLKCELPRFEIITLGPRSYARAVSADGSVVLGAFANPDGFWRPYFRSTGNMPEEVQGIPSNLRMANVRPNAISGNGLHWVGQYDSTASAGSPLPIGGTAAAIDMFGLPPDPVAYGALLDVDANATQPVGYVNNTQPGGYRAFFWNSQGMPSPLTPPMVGTMGMPQMWEAGATTRDGRITSGSLQDAQGSWWVVHWGAAGVTLPPHSQGPAGSRRIFVHGMSVNPLRVVGSYDDPAISGLAFVTDGGRFSILAPMGSGTTMGPVSTNAWDVNDDATVIVGDMDGGGMAGMPTRNAVVWPYQFPPAPRTVEDILRGANVDLRGAHLSIAYGVSADGKIVVGEAVDMGGGQVGFIARLP